MRVRVASNPGLHTSGFSIRGSAPAHLGFRNSAIALGSAETYGDAAGQTHAWQGIMHFHCQLQFVSCSYVPMPFALQVNRKHDECSYIGLECVRVFSSWHCRRLLFFFRLGGVDLRGGGCTRGASRKKCAGLHVSSKAAFPSQGLGGTRRRQGYSQHLMLSRS